MVKLNFMEQICHDIILLQEFVPLIIKYTIVEK